MDKTIIDFLNEQAKAASSSEQHISFHMPGHKGKAAIYEKTGYGDFLRHIMACDITEIPGADALFCPESTLLAVMENYADLYGVLHTELLVNGSSSGVMAAIMGTVPLGGKLILGRNSHHSAFSALRLGGINPVYLRPETDPSSGLVAEIDPYELERACKENPDASAVLITSPNYYGMMSDISQLATIAHDFGMVLIVDQAHGAHLRFFDYEAAALRSESIYIRHANHSAEALGADIVINSTHKTLLSFTGSGILNICSDRVNISAVSETLRMLQTTSPSYLLMGSLDINERIMREYWPSIIKRWREDLVTFYRRASRIEGLTLIGDESAKRAARMADTEEPISDFAMYQERAGLDMTKINISMAELGLTGDRLDRELRHRGIISEMVHGEFVMLMTGAGSQSADYDKLLEALKDISDSYVVGAEVSREPRSSTDFRLEVADVPLEYEEVPLYQADGRVLYDPVIVYPPGTPIACPGEILNLEVLSYISAALEDEEKVTGIDDDGMIRVGIGY
ncbi:MAG: DegT/DnrJ/EryC1/StrS family aminotransferase [Mogibacterium sp.]|nr:DegT/DnrJ/EryC1/StrS family aminotransferase [Mogibacterium sp.]